MISFLIIVPTLNSYRLLPRLVQSLQQQTWTQWNVLFIDGNSKSDHIAWLDDLCQHDNRFTWITQSLEHKGIYGAMNQGFEIASYNDYWLLFWGSDDIAASPRVFEEIASMLDTPSSGEESPDLLVCTGVYFAEKTTNHIKTSKGIEITRKSRFIWRSSLRRSMFFGSTPPHQATLFGPRVQTTLNIYDTGLRLAADLDYFLKLSRYPGLKVQVAETEIVYMGDSGISAQDNNRRFFEVSIAYKRAYQHLWIFPFIFRYLQRALSIVAFK